MLRQRTWLSSFATTATSLLLLATPLQAEPKAKEEPGATPFMIEGRSGVWFPLESAKHLRKLQLDYPYQLQRVSHLKQLLELRNRESSKLRILIAAEKKVTAERSIKLRLSETKVQQLQKDLTSWYRNPYVWFVAGLVVGGGTIVAVTR